MQTTWRLLRRLMTGVVLLVVVLYLAVNTFAVLDAHANKGEAVEDIEQALPKVRENALAQHERLRDAAGTREPTWSWAEVSCTWEGMASGWIVNAYRQDCRLQVFDLVPTDSVVGDGCENLEPGIEQDEEIASTLLRGPTAALAGERAWQADCPSDVMVHEDDDPRTVLTGKRPDDLGDVAAWTVLRTTAPLTATEIGCHRWTVLFCSEPGDPALPEA